MIASDRIEVYEQRLDKMFEILRNLNQRFGQTLEKEVPEIPEGLYQVKKNLLDIETPLEIADKMVFELKEVLPQNALQRPEEAIKHTSRWLQKTIRFSPEPEFKQENGPRIIALIGPTGVGKTTTIAKIAASYGLSVKDRLSIALFTLDTYRIGAADQLQQYAQIIDVDMEILYRAEDIDQAIDKHMDKDLIIIDTAGRCQKDAEELCELRNFLDRLPESDKYLVLSATAKYTDMLETVYCFDEVGFEHLIFTKIDETNTFGPLLAVLVKTGKSLAYITNGQKVPEDFRKADFNFFNSRLFPASFSAKIDLPFSRTQAQEF
jgi:flagellar biosynthesis protein FlhF